MAKSIPFNIKISVDGQEMVVKSIRNVKDFGQEIEITQSSVKRFSEAMKNLGNTAMALQGMTGALNQISNVLNNATEESRSFAAAMKAANTMAGKDAAGFEDLKDQVSELSKTIPLTRDALANGLYQVISNGVPENNWIDYLNASARAAVGGIADVGEVVKVTSTVIKNYGLEWSAAQDIQDKIQLTAKNGVTSFEQLAAALPSVTGQAAQLGVSFTEMLAVMSTLTSVTGDTSEVATQLSSVLTALTKESSKAQKMAAEMGIEFNAASIKAAGGLQNFLVQLDQTITAYAQKTGELRESIYAKLFGRAEALRLTNALTGQFAGKFAENIEQLDNSAGTINEVFDTMASTGASSIQMMKNKLSGITDAFASVTKGVQPILTVGSQVGMTAASFAMLSQTLSRLGVSAKIAGLSMSVLGAKTIKTAYAMTLMMTGSRGAAIAVGALAGAMRALLISTGIGIVLWGVSAAIDALSSSSDKASAAMEEQARATEMLEDAEKQGQQEEARLKVELDKNIKALKELIAANKDTSDIITELNRKYGESFGVYNTAAQWYDTLVSKSKIYCKQKGYEAQVMALSTKLAEKEIQLQENFDKRKDLWKQGNAQKTYKTDTWVDADGRVHEATTATVNTQEYANLKSEGADLIKDIKALNAQIDNGQAKIDEFAKQMNAAASIGKANVDAMKMSYKELGDEITKQKEEVARLAGKEGMEKQALAAAAELKKMEARYNQLGKKYGLGTGGSSGNKEPKYYETPTNEQQYRKNVSYYTGQLTGEDNEAQRNILKKIALWQQEIDVIELRKKKMAVPEELKSLDDIAKKMDYLTAKRKLASDSEIADIDKEIAATERKQKSIEMASSVQIDDDKISTYAELNRKREYYNYLVNEGAEDEIKAGRAGLDALDKVQKKLDEIGKINPPTENLSTIEEYDKAIQFYTEQQQKEDADNIQNTQQKIDGLTKGRRALQLGMELPSMQKEFDEIRKLSSKEYRIKIKGMGFEGLTEKIKELSKELDNPNLTATQREQLISLRKGYEDMRRDAALSFSTLTSGWDNIKGIGNSIENLSNALEGNADAWQTITTVVDTALQLYQGISAIAEIINMLTVATDLHTASKIAETTAIGASTVAEGADAGVQEVNAAAKAPVIAANKLATASYVELAAAEYMAAHASIPFAGFALGASFSASAAALVAAMGAMAFAEGGVISGPTLGLIGEYAGASTNPEVVAPLDKLRSMIQPQQVALPPGSIIAKVKGTDLLLVSSNTSRIRSKSGHRTVIK